MKHNIFHWHNGLGDYLDIEGDLVDNTSPHDDTRIYKSITIIMNEVKHVVKGCSQCPDLYIAETTTMKLTEDGD